MSHDRDVVDAGDGTSPPAWVLVAATLAAPVSWIAVLLLSVVIEDVGHTLQTTCAAGAACLVLAGHLVSIFALVTGLFAALPAAARSAVGILGVGYWAALLAGFVWLASTTGEFGGPGPGEARATPFRSASPRCARPSDACWPSLGPASYLGRPVPGSGGAPTMGGRYGGAR